LNPDNGRVVAIIDSGEAMAKVAQEIEQRGERPLREWVRFDIGEVIEVKGIRFKVHDVSDQRLVLKFANKQG
jgi:hypothetical protein